MGHSQKRDELVKLIHLDILVNRLTHSQLYRIGGGRVSAYAKGVWMKNGQLQADNILAHAWIGGQMRPNPNFDGRCDSCLMSKPHHTHDDRAFSGNRALRGDEH